MNWPTKQILGASLLCTLFLTTGCASTLLRDITKANGGRMDITYPSVRYAADSFKHPSKLTPLILIDLPFSVVLDTVMLPFDAASSRKSKKPESEVDSKQ
tara:strand:- start:208 stop:507 length:300 start_codon:yes stop_codon:yes gene_type:complete